MALLFSRVGEVKMIVFVGLISPARLVDKDGWRWFEGKRDS